MPLACSPQPRANRLARPLMFIAPLACPDAPPMPAPPFSCDSIRVEGIAVYAGGSAAAYGGEGAGAAQIQRGGAGNVYARAACAAGEGALAGNDDGCRYAIAQRDGGLAAGALMVTLLRFRVTPLAAMMTIGEVMELSAV
jgi:hypothetical protein